MLYKPMTTSMSSRFVSAGTSQDGDAAEGAAEKVNDATKAAKLKLFGSLTHEKIEWHPAKLLCIRFNVKHPYGDHSVVGVPASHKSKFDIFGRLEVSRNFFVSNECCKFWYELSSTVSDYCCSNLQEVKNFII